MNDRRLHGAWKLVSLDLTSEDGKVSFPMGENPVGHIVYSEDGYMSVAIMAGGRPRFASEDIGAGTPEEKLTAADSYVSYGGHYEIVGNEVIHHIEVSFFPNWISTAQSRFFKFEGDRLTLTTAPYKVYGKVQTARVVWRRANQVFGSAR